MSDKKQHSYNEEGDASHYDTDRLNSIIKMEAIWGTYAMMLHCEITAFKYRERIGKKHKGTTGIMLDLTKAEWYENAARYFWRKMQDNEFIHGNSSLEKKGLPWK